MVSSSEEWVFEHIQQLDYAELNSVVKTIEIAPNDMNNVLTKISLLRVVLRFLSSVDIETNESFNIFKDMETFIHNNYKMTPTSSPNYQESFDNLVTEVKKIKQKNI